MPVNKLVFLLLLLNNSAVSLLCFRGLFAVEREGRERVITLQILLLGIISGL